MKRTKFKSRSPWNTNNTRYDKKLDKLFNRIESIGLPYSWRFYPYVTDRVEEFFSETPYGGYENYPADSYKESILSALDQ